MHLYFISGLGADRSVFQKLEFSPVHTIHHIDWIPFRRGESLAEYARRLSAVIDTSRSFALIGLSLGGMLASEMTTFLQPAQTILISSAPTAAHLPPWFRLMGKLKLHYLTPDSAYRWSNAFTYWLFGLKTAEEKALYKSIVQAANPQFVRHAINAIMTWKKTDRPPGIHHFHGSKDRLLPVRYAKPDTVIQGGHLAVFTHAAELSLLLSQLLD